jgi:hypothetical protein
MRQEEGQNVKVFGFYTSEGLQPRDRGVEVLAWLGAFSKQPKA